MRELARLYAPLVKEVTIMGTPIVGGPKYTVVGQRYAKNHGLNLDEFEQKAHQRNAIGFEQPVTSIYSKSDGIVGWKASIDSYNP